MRAPFVLQALASTQQLKCDCVNVVELAYLPVWVETLANLSAFTEVDSGSNVNLAANVVTMNGSGSYGANGIIKSVGITRAQGYVEFTVSQPDAGNSWLAFGIAASNTLPSNTATAGVGFLGSATGIFAAVSGGAAIATSATIDYATSYRIRVYYLKNAAGTYQRGRITILGGAFTVETTVNDGYGFLTELPDPFYPWWQRTLNSATRLVSLSGISAYFGLTTTGPYVTYVADAGVGKTFENFDPTALAFPSGFTEPAAATYGWSFDDGAEDWSADLTLAQLNAVGKQTARHRYIRVRIRQNSDGDSQCEVTELNSDTATDSAGTAGDGVYPTESQVLNGIGFGPGGDDYTGNVVLPAVDDVKKDVTYGALSALTGTLGIENSGTTGTPVIREIFETGIRWGLEQITEANGYWHTFLKRNIYDPPIAVDSMTQFPAVIIEEGDEICQNQNVNAHAQTGGNQAKLYNEFEFALHIIVPCENDPKLARDRARADVQRYFGSHWWLPNSYGERTAFNCIYAGSESYGVHPVKKVTGIIVRFRVWYHQLLTDPAQLA